MIKIKLKLLRAAQDNNYVYSLFTVASKTGILLFELIFKFTWDSVDFEHKQISIGKTDYFTTQKINITDEVVDALLTIKKLQKFHKQLKGNKYNNDYNLVFTMSDGSNLTLLFVLTLFKKYALNAVLYECLLDHFSFYSFRETYIKRLSKEEDYPEIIIYKKN